MTELKHENNPPKSSFLMYAIMESTAVFWSNLY